MKPHHLPLLIALPLALFSTASADTIAEYTFTGASPNSTDSDPNSTAGVFDFGPQGTNWGFSGSAENVFARGNTTSSTEELALTNGSYFTFTVTPTVGLNLVSLNFDTLANAASVLSSGSADVTFFLRSSIDNYDATIAGSTFNQAYTNDTADNPVARSVDLSGAAFQGVTDPITFRFYLYDNSTNLNRTARLDNVILTTVPEPGTFAMLAGLCGLTYVMIRRR